VIEAPSGRALVVDAGSSYSLRAGQRCAQNVILPYLAVRGISRLDAVVITHPDADHCNALPGVLEAVPVGVVLESFPGVDSEVYASVKAAAAAARVPIVQAFAGGTINLGANARAAVLWPTGTPSDEAFDDNDRSIVLRLTHRQVTVLLTGDIGAEVESELLRRRATLAADLLQVPHHGSDRSSGWPFLQAVAPSVAVVSCQAGDPAHPAPLIESRLRELGTQVWRTDRAGAVTIVSDGRGIMVRGHAYGRRAQSRSPVWAQAWESASRTRSASVSASSATSAGSLGRSASMIRRPMSARMSAVSSDLRSRNRRIMRHSSGATLPALERSIVTR